MPEENQSFFQRVHAFQQDVDAIAKDATNPFFKSKYFDINSLIEAIKPHLATHRLTIAQPLNIVEGKQALLTMLMDADSDAVMQSAMFIPDQPDPQKFGALITYYRRYALQSMLLLAAEDDDGNTAKPKGETRETYKGPLQGKVTEKQVGLINVLLKKYGMPREDFKKKYVVTSLNDLTKDQASKAIDELNKRIEAGEMYDDPSVPNMEVTDEDIANI